MMYPELDTGILDEMSLTPKEKAFIESSHQADPGSTTRARIISEFYAAKTLTRATDRMAQILPSEAIRIVGALNTATQKMIESNEKVAESNEKSTKTITRLTAALLIFAAVEAIATAVSVLK